MEGAMIPDWEEFKVPFLPVGVRGDYEIARFEVSKADEDFGRMRACNPSSYGRYVSAGRYTKLTRGGSLIMSDTEDEIRDHRGLVYASGRVLLHGLGLGVAVGMALKNPRVKHVTVVEIAEEVIGLVGPTWKKRSMDMQTGGSRLEIINDDALTWKPPRGARLDFAWHDIWDSICADNKKTMSILHRRFGKRVKSQDSWGRDGVEN